MDYRYQGAEAVRMERVGDAYQVQIGERRYHVQVIRAADGEITFLIDGQRYQAQVAHAEATHWIALEGTVVTLTTASPPLTRRHAHAQTTQAVVAAMPGQVVKVMVSEGEHVERGQALIMLEAMKMEMRINAPQAGHVTQVLCSVGQVVQRDQVLVMVSA